VACHTRVALWYTTAAATRPGISHGRGEDLGTPVSEDYKEGDNKFTGMIDKVTITVTPPPAQVQKEEEGQEAVIDEGIN